MPRSVQPGEVATSAECPRQACAGLTIPTAAADMKIERTVAFIDLGLCWQQPAKYGLALLIMTPAGDVDVLSTKALDAFNLMTSTSPPSPCCRCPNHSGTSSGDLGKPVIQRDLDALAVRFHQVAHYAVEIVEREIDRLSPIVAPRDRQKGIWIAGRDQPGFDRCDRRRDARYFIDLRRPVIDRAVR
jgi:hypothetical protein